MKFPMNRWTGPAIVATAWLGMALIAGCSGTDGKDGRDGIAGATGPSGTAECMQCHTDDYTMQDFLLPTITDFDLSQHHLGSTYQRSTNPCSRCHTNEGYQKFVATGQIGVVTNSSSIGCFTCHAPHTNKNFNLRKTGATTLDLGGTYDKGASNTCALCHQAWVPSPAIADTSALNSRWGPHHGPQASILSGNGAWAFGGIYSSSHPHKTIADGCVQCHMAATPSERSAGGHTFRAFSESGTTITINSMGCAVTDCHEGQTDAQMTTKVTDRAAEFDAAVEEIKAILLAKGWVDEAGEPVAPGPRTAVGRGALYNFLMLEADNSHGVHNPTYIDDILEQTKTQLEALPL